MVHKKTFLIFAFFFGFVGLSYPQHVKPKFKRIIYISYRPVDTGKNLSILMDAYREFRADGTCHIILNFVNGLNYNGYGTDTTFKMPDTLILKLNNIFNGERQLKSYLIKDQSPTGSQYGGATEFFKYTAGNGKSDSLIAVSFLLDGEFNSILKEMWHLPRARYVRQGIIHRNKVLEVEIIKEHKACKYLPKFGSPPIVKHLTGVGD